MVVGVLAQTDVLVSMDSQEEDAKQVIVYESEVTYNIENTTVNGLQQSWIILSLWKYVTEEMKQIVYQCFYDTCTWYKFLGQGSQYVSFETEFASLQPQQCTSSVQFTWL